MADNLTIESPDFDRIRKEAGVETEDAIKLLWYVANEESKTRRRGIRESTEKRVGKVLSDAPTTQRDNYDAKGSFMVMFTGSTNFTITGIRNGEDGYFLVIHNVGSATITLNHESASSDASNRLTFAAAANKSLGNNKTVVLLYLNSRWRELSLA